MVALELHKIFPTLHDTNESTDRKLLPYGTQIIVDVDNYCHRDYDNSGSTVEKTRIIFLRGKRRSLYTRVHAGWFERGIMRCKHA